jgi:hypothetical protein
VQQKALRITSRAGAGAERRAHKHLSKPQAAGTCTHLECACYSCPILFAICLQHPDLHHFSTVLPACALPYCGRMYRSVPTQLLKRGVMQTHCQRAMPRCGGGCGSCMAATVRCATGCRTTGQRVLAVPHPVWLMRMLCWEAHWRISYGR